MASQDTSIEHELRELTEQVQGLLFLSESDDITLAELERVQERFDHVLHYARCLGYRAAFLWKDGDIAIEWQPTVRPS